VRYMRALTTIAACRHSFVHIPILTPPSMCTPRACTRSSTQRSSRPSPIQRAYVTTGSSQGKRIRFVPLAGCRKSGLHLGGVHGA
jgi:hypothetical protein